MRFDPAVWGTVSDWATFAVTTLACAVTTLALLAAGVAGLLAYKAFKLQEKQEKDRLDSARRHQAERVVAWWDHNPPDRGTRGRGPAVTFFNSSGLPVWEVDLLLSHGPGRRWFYGLGLQPSTDKPILTDAWGGEPNPEYSYGIEIEFRDAAGLYWRRDQDGVLHEIREGRAVDGTIVTDWEDLPNCEHTLLGGPPPMK